MGTNEPDTEYNEREIIHEDINFTSDSDSLQSSHSIYVVPTCLPAYSPWVQRWSNKPVPWYGRCRVSCVVGIQASQATRWTFLASKEDTTKSIYG